jgi:tRNA pseudouridine38-40 synthase
LIIKKVQTWKLEIEYEGTRYRGWQIQPEVRTVQGELAKAVADIFANKTEIGGAGRTDAGVHALAQIAHLRVYSMVKEVKPRQLIYALNDRLPHDINILRAKVVPNEFHARHRALSRQYLYQISTRRTAFAKNHVWWVKDKLDLQSMNQATKLLVGKHNFQSFCELENEKNSTEVNVNSAQLMLNKQMIYFRINARNFLWKMVRRLTGTLVEIGRGNLTVPEFEQMLVEKSNFSAKFTAPPSGLFLEKVFYPADEDAEDATF